MSLTALLRSRLFIVIVTILITLGGVAVPGLSAHVSNTETVVSISSTLDVVFPTRPDIDVISHLSEAEFSTMKASLAAPSDFCFPETGNCITGRFAEYFWAMGGVPVFGFPISGEFKETSVTDGKEHTVQYFQRNLFEAHPENAQPNDVLSALLGLEEYKARYFFVDLSRLLELYYGKFTTSPNDIGPFIKALDGEFDSRLGHAGDNIPASGATLKPGSVFWTNTGGKSIGGTYTVLAQNGSVIVGYAHTDVFVPTGGRWLRIYGFFDPRMMIDK